MRILLPLSLCLTPLLFLAAHPLKPDTPIAAPAMALRTVQSGGMTRYFRVHEPTGYNPLTPTPLVMAFHGGGGNARQFADHTELYQTADAEDFLLVFPEGTGNLGGPPLYLLETWNAGNCCGYAEENGIDDVQFVRDMVASLAGEWNVDLDHVYATGHSNGGMMSYRLGMEAPDLVTAIAPNAASLGVSGLPALPVPLLVMHGKLDTNVPYRGGVGSGVSGTDFESQRASVQPFMIANGATDMQLAETRGQAQRFESVGTGGTGASIHYWWLKNGGHSWPGHGSAGMPGEPTNYDIDANDEIWAFFSQF